MAASERPASDVTTTWKFGLGDEVKDLMTGMQGIIAARVEFLDGCRRYLVQVPKPTKDGDAGPERNVDEGLLVLIKASKVTVENKMPAVGYQPVPGGPKDSDRVATGRGRVASTSR